MSEETTRGEPELRRQIAALEAENHALRVNYGAAALEHAHAAELLAACHRLHATLDREQVLVAVEDVLGSLVSCQEAAVYDLDGEPARLTLTGAVGLPVHAVPPLPPAALSAIKAGRLFIASPYGAGAAPRPLACMPLRVDGKVTGALALVRLLDQKRGLTNAEWEALDAIGTHIATALIASRPRVADFRPEERGHARCASAK